jgi:hypothetical protein
MAFQETFRNVLTDISQNIFSNQFYKVICLTNVGRVDEREALPRRFHLTEEREIFIDNLLVQVHLITEMVITCGGVDVLKLSKE